MTDEEIKECTKLYTQNFHLAPLTLKRCMSIAISRQINDRDVEEIIARFKAMKFINESQGLDEDGFKPMTYNGMPLVGNPHAGTLKGISRASYPFWRSKVSKPTKVTDWAELAKNIKFSGPDE
jgi:hypothetical protein